MLFENDVTPSDHSRGLVRFLTHVYTFLSHRAKCHSANIATHDRAHGHRAEHETEEGAKLQHPRLLVESEATCV
ncbi:hypothetical protein M407DRAFT_134687 [Tulasnella calospora MUT 4182]|uniref:Uncharacterized protein n=1 Tax=Tulasnella calospora MUT 4182 TaxID=1051891 RepID=A0A0C3PYZ5_9AGAM|nr:hypothetical protein M407DRAFT_134687 [Tulasnella calospora MUT 4182]